METPVMVTRIQLKKGARMATRSRTSFQKRQKELLRMEKQKDKVSKRLERKSSGESPLAEDLGEPLDGPRLPEDFFTEIQRD